MKKILLSIVLFCSFLFQGNAQKFNYENTSRIFMDLGAGLTWHTSDVKNNFNYTPLGIHLGIGATFNRNYGKLFTYDLRLRLMGGSWYGVDKDSTSALENNVALSNYYGSLGYAAQNFRAFQLQSQLELAIHFNRIKERTGFDPYIFGGIGLTFTKTRGDLYSGTNNNYTLYDYETTPNGSIIDGKFNGKPTLDKNDKGDQYGFGTIHWTPDVGIGLDYWITSNFAIGFEHQTTFARTDYFDGTTVTQNGIPRSGLVNDLFHYTNIHLKWYLKPIKRNKPPKEIPPVVDAPVVSPPTPRIPSVNFTNPYAKTENTNSPNFNLIANVQNVASSNNLTFTQNGQIINAFSFNASQNKFQSNVVLTPGANVFYLQGVNNDGQASDQVTIYYEREMNPPTVNITEPGYSPYTVNQLQYTVRATIKNIASKSQLTVALNGHNITNYNFTTLGNNNFSVHLNLQSGTNVLSITATNQDGTDSDQATIVYNRTPVETGNPPIVKIVTPSYKPYTTYNSSENVVAIVNNVTEKQQITVRVNGSKQTNFTFNPTSQTVNVNAGLTMGNNTVQITATNNYGNDNDQIQIIRQQKVNPPKVTITDPNKSPITVNQTSYTIIATLLNVANRNQLIVTLNGQPFSDFTFNPTGLSNFKANVNLQGGSNIFSITATNEAGSDADNKTIIYQRTPIETGNPPIVKIVTPASSSYTTANPTENVVAEVYNVMNQQQIAVRVNGSETTNFTFNSLLKTVSLNAPLVTGNNTIQISATNDYGSDSDQVQIVHKRAVNPPTVKITDPGSSPTVVNQSSYLVKATVLNIESRNQLSVTLNGHPLTNYTFNATGLSNFSAQLNLQAGTNVLSITGSNEIGSATDQTTIIYRKVNTPPTVKITTPSTNPFTTSNERESIIAQTTQITNSSQIIVKVNGVSLSDFNFNGTTGKITFQANLKIGTNNIIIGVQNEDGQSSDQIQVVYKQATATTLKPIVKFVNPAQPNTTIAIKEFEMKASVMNVSSGANIQIYFNNNLVPQNKVVYNSLTKMVSFSAALSNGKNTFRVIATNGNQFDEASTDISWKKISLGGTKPTPISSPCDKPEIKISNPKKENTNTDATNFVVQASITHLSSNNQLKVYHNNTLVNSSRYSYNTVTYSFMDKFDLLEGNNVYRIVATNDCGSTEKTINVKYTPPVCGVQIDMNVNQADFCLVTSGGIISYMDLMNNTKLTYNGQSTSLYFKAKENGVVKVGGNDYAVVKGNYYHFIGIFTVELSKNRPGFPNQWSVCVEAMRNPTFGKGSKKPASPCVGESESMDGEKNNNEEGKRVRTPSKSKPNTSKDIEGTPIINDKKIISPGRR